MESNNQSSLFNELSVSYDMGNSISETSRWCRFIAIVGLIFFGLFALILVIASSKLVDAFSQVIPGFAMAGGGLVIGLILLFIVLGGGMLVLLLRFAMLTRRGLLLRNQALFLQGLQSIKLYFIIYGVFAILGVLSNAFTLFK